MGCLFTGLQCLKQKGKKGRCRGQENMAESQPKGENMDHANKVKTANDNQGNHQLSHVHEHNPNAHQHSSKHVSDDKTSSKEGHHHGDHQHGHTDKNSKMDQEQTLG